MTQRIDVTTTKKPVRQFLQELGTLRSPVELVVEDTVVAKLIPPAELSEKEKQRILDKGWQAVQCARSRTRGIPASVIQKEVDEAVREVRARHANHRG